MKVYKTAESFSISRHLNRLCVYGGDANNFYFDDGHINYIKYGVELAPYIAIEYLDKTYLLHLREGGGPSLYRYFQDGLVNLVSLDGKALKLPPEQLFCIANNQNTEGNGLYINSIYNFPQKGRQSIAVFNAALGAFNSIERDLFVCTYKDGFFYSLDMSTGCYVKIALDFTDQWTYQPADKWNQTGEALILKGVVYVFLGPKEEKRQLVGGRGQHLKSGGELVALNDADGALNWKREFPNSVDEFHLVDDKLYVLSLNEVLVIDPGSGEETGRIDTQTSVPFNRMMRPTIFLDQRYLYYTHYDDALILVYDRETLSLAKRIDMPEGYRVKRHDFHDTRTGKHYFVLHNLTQYGALWPILELEPNDLDAPVEFEPEPDMQIDFVPSQDGQPGRELVIRLRTESLDDALRFGEIYTRDHAQWHSYNYMGMSFAGRQPTPDFNGLIRFQYSGCNQPRDVVEEHLRFMEERFKKWNAKEGFYSCIDKKQPVRLVAEYLEG